MDSKKLFEHYPDYKEYRLETDSFEPETIWNLLPPDKEQAGTSAEDRPLYLLSRGRGNKKVLLWTQMHGDEPTATMAVLDLFRFLEQNDALNPMRDTILERLQLRVLPLLNPDGAARKQRRTAWEIDPNRDFLETTCPESAFLRAQAETFQPDWGFNLHDQNRFYRVGSTCQPPVLTFLAPPPAAKAKPSGTYAEVQQLIGNLSDALTPLLSGKLARYPADFEARAFGDNLQRMGIRTILFEGGFIPKDEKRQALRRYYFTALLTALYIIAENSYKEADQDTYAQLPDGEERFFDLLIRQLRFQQAGKSWQTDIGLRREETGNWRVTDLGDLQDYCGHEIWDGCQWDNRSDFPAFESRVRMERSGNKLAFQRL